MKAYWSKYDLMDRPKAAAAFIRQWVALPPVVTKKQIEVADDRSGFHNNHRSNIFGGGDVPLMAVKAEVWNACDYWGEHLEPEPDDDATGERRLSAWMKDLPKGPDTRYVLHLEVGIAHDEFERYEARWKREVIEFGPHVDEPVYGPWRFLSWDAEWQRLSGRTFAGVKKLIAQSNLHFTRHAIKSGW
jgi:hypothetical protein